MFTIAKCDFDDPRNIWSKKWLIVVSRECQVLYVISIRVEKFPIRLFQRPRERLSLKLILNCVKTYLYSPDGCSHPVPLHQEERNSEGVLRMATTSINTRWLDHEMTCMLKPRNIELVYLRSSKYA
jgi:hypothetical protein